MWDKSILFKEIYEIHLIHILLQNYYVNQYEANFNEEDLFLSLILGIILKINLKTNFSFEHHSKPNYCRSYSQNLDNNSDNFENIICSLLDSINYFFKGEQKYGKNTYEVFLNFFQKSLHLQSIKIFKKLFHIILNKYQHFNEKFKLKFFIALIPTSQVNDLIIHNISKNKMVIRDLYEFFQKEFDYSQILEDPNINLTGIENLVKELIIVKMQKCDIFEEEIMFFLTSFSKNYFNLKMKIINNAVEILIKKDLIEKKFLLRNLVNFFLFLMKDFYNSRSTILTQFDAFLSIMDMFYKYFLENEIFYSFLLPNINFEKLQDIDIMNSSDFNSIPKIQGIFYIFIFICFQVLKKLVSDNIPENKEKCEIRIITLLRFIKQLILSIKKNENQEKNKKINKSMIETNDNEKTITLHSKNFQDLFENQEPWKYVGFFLKEDSIIIFDFILYELFINSMIIIRKCSIFNEKMGLKNSESFIELSFVIVEAIKNSDFLINFINDKTKIKKIKNVNILKKSSSQQDHCEKVYYFGRIQKNIQKILEYSQKNTSVSESFNEADISLIKIKDYFKKFLNSSNNNELLNFILEESELIESLIVPSMQANRIFIPQLVFFF